MGPLRRLGTSLTSVSISSIPPISEDDFNNALKNIKPSVPKSRLAEYTKWMDANK